MAKKLTNSKPKPRSKLKGLAKPTAQLGKEQARKIRGGTGYQIISAGPDSGFKAKK